MKDKLISHAKSLILSSISSSDPCISGPRSMILQKIKNKAIDDPDSVFNKLTNKLAKDMYKDPSQKSDVLIKKSSDQIALSSKVIESINTLREKSLVYKRQLLDLEAKSLEFELRRFEIVLKKGEGDLKTAEARSKEEGLRIALEDRGIDLELKKIKLERERKALEEDSKKLESNLLNTKIREADLELRQANLKRARENDPVELESKRVRTERDKLEVRVLEDRITSPSSKSMYL